MMQMSARKAPRIVPDIKLLVIDDDLVQRHLIGRLGAQAGFNIVESGSFYSADRLLREMHFDCITLDLTLADQNGLKLLKTVVDTNTSAPVIVISGADQEFIDTTVGLARSAGIVAESFAKPFHLNGLRSAMKRQFNKAVQRYCDSGPNDRSFPTRPKAVTASSPNDRGRYLSAIFSVRR